MTAALDRTLRMMRAGTGAPLLAEDVAALAAAIRAAVDGSARSLDEALGLPKGWTKIARRIETAGFADEAPGGASARKRATALRRELIVYARERWPADRQRPHERPAGRRGELFAIMSLYRGKVPSAERLRKLLAGQN